MWVDIVLPGGGSLGRSMRSTRSGTAAGGPAGSTTGPGAARSAGGAGSTCRASVSGVAGVIEGTASGAGTARSGAAADAEAEASGPVLGSVAGCGGDMGGDMGGTGGVRSASVGADDSRAVGRDALGTRPDGEGRDGRSFGAATGGAGTGVTVVSGGSIAAVRAAGAALIVDGGSGGPLERVAAAPVRFTVVDDEPVKGRGRVVRPPPLPVDPGTVDDERCFARCGGRRRPTGLAGHRRGRDP